jgi:hypothetical protein
MAFQLLPTASVTFGFTDETGSKATLSVDVASSEVVADVQASADALRPLIEAITGCAVISQSITYSQIDDAQPAPAVGSRVERKGVFIFRTTAGKTVTYQVPGIEVGILDSGRIDEDNADVSAFVAKLNGDTEIYTDSNGQALGGLIKAYERYRSSTRAMLPNQRQPDVDTTPDG